MTRLTTYQVAQSEHYGSDTGNVVITCGGPFDEAARSYLDDNVVTVTTVRG